MRIWVIGSEAGGHSMARALSPALQSLVPALEFKDVQADDGAWAAVERNDGALLCVTPSALASEELFFDLGGLQGAVGTEGFVAPVLLDLSPEDLAQTPLAIFQCTRAQRGDFEALVADLLRRAGLPSVLDPLAAGFDSVWDDLSVRLADIPGQTVRPFLVTLLLPERPVSFGFDGSTEDAAWDDSVGDVLRSLADSPLKPPPFDPGSLVPLDVEFSRWTELPRRLSRVHTSHLALVSPMVVEEAHGDARTLARGAREEAMRFGTYGGAQVMPWKFMKVGDNLVLMRNVR